MNRQEFIERTGYTPADEEYKFIEASYYDFDGDKDAYCKWFTKAQKEGYWKRELELRMHLKTRIAEINEKDYKVADLEDEIAKLTKEKQELRGKYYEADNIAYNRLCEVNAKDTEIAELKQTVMELKAKLYDFMVAEKGEQA